MDDKRRQLIAAGRRRARRRSRAFPGLARAQGARPESANLALGFGVDPPFAPHILGITQGWFKDAGFPDVKTRTFTAGALAGEALLAGEIQLWTPGNLPPISMASNGSPIVVLGTNCVNWNLEKLVVRNDANVNAPEDLYRIKIGLLQGSTSSALLHYLAQHYKLDPQKLQVVNLPPPEQLAGLASGTVQALLCWEPWPHRALATGQAKVVHTGSTSHFAANKGADGPRLQQPVDLRREPGFRAQEPAARSRGDADGAAAWPAAVRRSRPTRRDGPDLLRVPEAGRGDEPPRSGVTTSSIPPSTRRTWRTWSGPPRSSSRPGASAKRINVLDYTYTDPLERIDPALVKVRGRWKA